MECEAARAQLADRLTGTLAPEASAALNEHLRSCATCAVDASAVTDTWTLLGDIPATEPDSAAMRARFDRILEASTPAPRWWMAHGLQAAAAVILVAHSVPCK